MTVGADLDWVRPLVASVTLWGFWFIGWTIAAAVTALSRRQVAWASFAAEASYRIPTIIGAFLMFAGSRRIAGVRIGSPPLWALQGWAGWTLTGLVAAGLLFTVWARVVLGNFWSSSVARREGHELVSTGPYGLVRHPIYTGLILAGWALAVQFGGVANLLGAAVWNFALWQKARVEERFLGEQLGETAYADYRARAPMLVPFWR